MAGPPETDELSSLISCFKSARRPPLCAGGGPGREDDEAGLLRAALAALADEPPLRVLRKLRDRRDQGITLIERSLLGSFSVALKRRLAAWASVEPSGCANFATGALLGLVVGDWVGAPLEFCQAVDEPSGSRWSHSEFRCENPNTEEKERGVLKPGQWTDDSSMALCLADSLIACRGVHGSDLRVRFWSWHAEGYNCTFRFDNEGSTNCPEKPPRASFGLGYNIAKSLLALAPGEDVAPQFLNPGSSDSGNGGLMRLAPIPIFFAALSVEEAMEAAAQSSLATHPGALATEAAKCLAFILHRGIGLPASKRSRGARTFLIEVCDEYNGILAQREKLLAGSSSGGDEAVALRELRALLASEKPAGGPEACWNWRARPLPVLATLKARGEKYNGYPVSRPYFGSYCMDGMAMALYAVAETSTFHRAIERAVNFLGDADTVGAIAGQIAGAFYGKKAIDPRYTDPIAHWDHDEISCRAVLCLMLGRAQASETSSRGQRAQAQPAQP